MKLNIDKELLDNANSHALKNGTNITAHIESYFKSLNLSNKRLNILDLIEGLEKPNLSQYGNLKEYYYQDKLNS
ncbi:MAG: hypothetical protein B7Y69_05015 [Sphingobacteriia bacterium 35-40-8]|nr:MAG: hypothetical protein B7Y69_05015 [Sphingobacteriia bacterium 35-40-8]